MYTYFVSYAVYNDGQPCFGNVQIEVPTKVTKNNSAESLHIMKNVIEKMIKLENVIILNFILLEEE